MRILAAGNNAVVELTKGELELLTDDQTEGAVVDLIPIYRGLVAAAELRPDLKHMRAELIRMTEDVDSLIKLVEHYEEIARVTL